MDGSYQMESCVAVFAESRISQVTDPYIANPQLRAFLALS